MDGRASRREWMLEEEEEVEVVIAKDDADSDGDSGCWEPGQHHHRGLLSAMLCHALLYSGVLCCSL